eukprot:Amastigsp_a511888_6.p3 type:complete len:110 gc:universal Amastigsp_a511888_6:669-340(-)
MGAFMSATTACFSTNALRGSSASTPPTASAPRGRNISASRRRSLRRPQRGPCSSSRVQRRCTMTTGAFATGTRFDLGHTKPSPASPCSCTRSWCPRHRTPRRHGSKSSA